MVIASGNQLTSATVNALLSQLAANGLANGTVDSSGQTPSAPPTGSGLTAKAALVLRGWSVTTD
jgi:hypothetical protein